MDPETMDARQMDARQLNTENEVRRIEAVRLRALVERDLVTADPLHAPDYQLVTPNGSVLGKDEYLGRVASRSLEYLAFEAITDVVARSSTTTVVLRYQARIALAVAHDVEEFVAWHTDLYELRDAAWVVVWSQATIVA